MTPDLYSGTLPRMPSPTDARVPAPVAPSPVRPPAETSLIEPRPASRIGATISIVGHLEIAEDVHIDGRIDGGVAADGFVVVVAPTAHVTGDILARDITIAGRFEGTALASEVVEILSDACVTGRLLTPSVIVADGALFNGSVEPERADAARRVRSYRRTRDAGAR